MMNVERVSAAQRRRGRRLRAALRHERQSIAMALAEMSHHTAPRGLRMARAGGEESEMNTATGQKTPLPRAASTVHFNLFDEGDVLAARPTPLVEVRPQPGVQRHTAEQIIETFVPVQILDAPVPQMGGGTGGRILAELRRAGRCRAGYRSAEDLAGQGSAAYGGPCTPAADGGTAGGCADDHHVLFFAVDC